MEKVGANELSFTPVGSWVVERGLFRFLSVYRTFGPHGLFSFSFSFLSLSFLLSSPLLFLNLSLSVFRLFSLFISSLASVLCYTRFSQLFCFAISFPRQRFFFSLSTCMLLTPVPSLFAPYFALYTRAFFRLLLLSVPTAWRIHCEIDRPKRVPEWPERTRKQQEKEGN